MQVIPPRLVQLGDTSHRSARELALAVEESQDAWTLGPQDAGNSAQGPVFVETHGLLATVAGNAVVAMAKTLERDRDALYQTAFAFSDVDEETARRFTSPPGTGEHR